MNYSFDENELTREKSLWDIYAAAKRIKLSKFSAFVLLGTVVFLSIDSFAIDRNYHALLLQTRIWAEFGFQFSVSILGFLIAGFTIFATLTKADMLLTMMVHFHEETGLRFLKYNFFCFMRVFIYYLFFLFVYLAIILFCQPNGLFAVAIGLLPYNLCLRIVATKIAYVVVGTSFVFLILQLKSFIFNIYSSIMNSLRWEVHKNEGRKPVDGSEI